MKRFLKSAATLSALSVLAIAPMVLSAGAASAQGLETLTGKQGMTSNYVGAAAGANFHDLENAEAGQIATGSLQGRYAIPETPLSVRGGLYVNNQAAAIVPMVSVDLPVTNNANLYGGVGYSFVTDEGKSTALGDRNSLVLATGIEAAVQKNIALFGDLKVGLNAYERSDDPAVSLQIGAAYRF